MSQSTTNSVHVGYLVDKLALEQIFLRVFWVISVNRKRNNAPYSFNAAASEVCESPVSQARCVTAYAVSLWLLPAEGSVQSQALHVGYLVDKLALEQIFLRVFRVIPANRKRNNAPYSFNAAASEVCESPVSQARCATAYAVSLWLLTAEGSVQSQGSSCEICSGMSWSWGRIFSEYFCCLLLFITPSTSLGVEW
jgi:hypothetical protein